MISKLSVLQSWLIKNSLKFEALSLLKLSGKKEDLIQQHPEFEGELNEAEEANIKPAFLRWVVSQLVRKESIKEIISMIDAYNRFHKNLNKKDLYQYTSLGELRGVIESLNSKSQEKKKNRQSISGDFETIYEDESVMVVNPHSREASCYFGKGTQWCVSATISSNYFNTYSASNVFLYFVLSSGNIAEDTDYLLPKYNKIAFAYAKDSNIETTLEIFDAEDNRIDMADVEGKFGKKKTTLMLSKIQEHLANQDKTKFTEYLENLTPDSYRQSILNIKSEEEKNEFKMLLRSNTSTPPAIMLSMAKESEWVDEELTVPNDDIIYEKYDLLSWLDIRLKNKRPPPTDEFIAVAKQIFLELSGELHNKEVRARAIGTCQMPDVLKKIYETTDDRHTKIQLIRHDKTPPELLQKIFNKGRMDYHIVSLLVNARQSPPSLLSTALKDAMVLSNKKQLELFDIDVGAGPNGSDSEFHTKRIIDQHRENTRIIGWIAQNEATVPADLEEIYKYSKGLMVLAGSQRPKGRIMSAKAHKDIQLSLSKNRALPMNLLKKLLNSELTDVKSFAEYNLKQRETSERNNTRLNISPIEGIEDELFGTDFDGR